MATITTRPMTFEEFAKLPEPQGLRYELHHGELVEMPKVRNRHAWCQERLVDLLKRIVGDAGVVFPELGFTTSGDDYRQADVAYLPRSRWNALDPKDFLRGAPDLVIEVLSPSNTISEMRDKRKLCLSNGSIEFWLIDSSQREVEVYRADRELTTYQAGQHIPLFFGQSSTISVDAIFEQV
jgi:Uma2 family endonuclease